MDLATLLSVAAALIVAMAAVGSFMYKLAQPKDHKKDPVSEISEETKVLKTKQEALEKELDSLTNQIVQESERTDREIGRIRDELKDLTDMVIKMILDAAK